MSNNIYHIPVKTITGENVTLESYQGKTLLIVNVASRCGFTPQYKELEALYQQYQSQGLVILGFPCNQFSQQEPGSEKDIQQFCQLNYGVTFPLFSKIEVNGSNAHPLYQLLKKQARGILGTTRVKWNFTKFLINSHGDVVKRFSPQTKIQTLIPYIKKNLSA